MEVFISELPVKAYCRILRQKLDSPFYVFDERMNGIVIGPFFSLAHHAEWEWNRKITSECNRAWGYVQEKHGKTKVRFIRGKGQLSPLWVTVFAVIINILCYIQIGQWPAKYWLVGFLISAAVCAVTAFEDSMTENGIAGAEEITRMLRDPEGYFC